MKGYSFYQSMHPDGKAHGGSPILISKIQHHDSLHFSTQQIQSTNIIIDDWIGELQITAIYTYLLIWPLQPATSLGLS